MEEDLKNGARAYGILAVICLFALALFWSVDPSIRWIFFGAAVGFGFLYLFKRDVFNFKLTDFIQQQQNSGRHQSSRPSSLTASEKGALYLGVGTIVALVFAFAIYAISTGFESQDGEGQSVELTSEESSSPANNADDMLERGNDFYNKSQFDSALAYYQRALTLRADFKEAYYNIALVYSNRSDFSNAIVVMKKCLAVHPDYGDGLQLIGGFYVQQEQNDEALRYFERAYETGTRNAELSDNLAYLYEQKNEIKKAIMFYKEAIQLDSSKVEVYRRLAELEPENASEYNRKAEAWSRSQ